MIPGQSYILQAFIVPSSRYQLFDLFAEVPNCCLAETYCLKSLRLFSFVVFVIYFMHSLIAAR